MPVDYSIISIGTLACNPLWGEGDAVRSAHATTTLVTSGEERILIDPSLPAAALDARLYERSGLRLKDITKVFLTSFRACHRMALPVMDDVPWFLHDDEKAYVDAYLRDLIKHSAGEVSADDRQRLGDELDLLHRCKSAPTQLARDVQIFPSPGATPGCCAVLLTPVVGTVVVAGEAIISRIYLEQGRVSDESADATVAQQSMQDILEVADFIVPGYDNVFPVLGKLFGV